MAEIGEQKPLNPLYPVTPTRPTTQRERPGRQPEPKKRQLPTDEDHEEPHIDEYA